MSEIFVRSLCNLLQIAFNSQTTKTDSFKRENVTEMKAWTRPGVKEVHPGCEINSYAPGEI